MSSEFNGVRSSCDIFARNSDLYFDVSCSCSAFSSRDLLASSTSLFFPSTSSFCLTRRCALSCNSSLALLNSSVNDCDCSRSPSVLELASIVFSTIPILSVNWLRKSRCVSLKLSNDASSMTALISFSKSTGSTIRLAGDAFPSPEPILK